MNGIELDVRGEGHDIFIDPSAKLRESRLRIKDDNCRVHIGADVSGKWDLTVSRGGTLIIGDRTTCESAVVAAQTEQVVIGRDCMLSFSVEIRTTDTHAIYDVDTGERVNPDQPVVIGDHVWLAKQVVVLKGTTIGSGSTIGTRGLASGTYPPLSLSAGVPARVLRDNVTWTRRVGKGQLELDPNAMAALTTIRTHR